MKTYLLLMIAAAFSLTACATGKIDAYRVTIPYTDFNTVKEGDIVHLPTGRHLTEEELMSYLSGHRVVYVGESHDSVEDHTVQLKVLKALERLKPGQVALGLEMLRTDAQEGVDKWVSGEMSEKDFLRLWIKNWGASWPYYSEIMNFSREKKIPVVAMNRIKTAMAPHKLDNPGEPAPPPPAIPEPEIDYDDPYYKEYIGAFFAGHDAGPEIEKKFMKGQLLWDETMAQAGADFLKKPENANRTLVVFAGGNHVRYSFGVPKRLFRRLPASYAIVETLVLHYPEAKKDKLMSVDLPENPLRAADVYWMVGYSDLEDQIIRLGVGIADAEGGGVEVKEVFDESSAKKAGVEKGDIITELDGEPIKEMFDLTYQLTKKKKDAEGRLTVRRGENVLTLPVTYAPVKNK